MRRFALVLVGALAACGGSHSSDQGTTPVTTTSTPAPVNSCEDYQKAALDSLTKALDAYGACKTAADCTTVAFGGACVDACSRAIAVTDVDAFGDAVADVDRTQCQAYANAGCPTPVPPPCEPPSTPVCSAGRCQ